MKTYPQRSHEVSPQRCSRPPKDKQAEEVWEIKSIGTRPLEVFTDLSNPSRAPHCALLVGTPRQEGLQIETNKQQEYGKYEEGTSDKRNSVGSVDDWRYGDGGSGMVFAGLRVEESGSGNCFLRSDGCGFVGVYRPDDTGPLQPLQGRGLNRADITNRIDNGSSNDDKRQSGHHP